jgi:hypothetical protein
VKFIKSETRRLHKYAGPLQLYDLRLNVLHVMSSGRGHPDVMTTLVAQPKKVLWCA